MLSLSSLLFILIGTAVALVLTLLTHRPDPNLASSFQQVGDVGTSPSQVVSEPENSLEALLPRAG